MKKRMILAVASILGLSGSARAQFGPCAGLHGGFVHRGGFHYGFSLGGPEYRFGAFGGGFFGRPVVVAPPVYGWGPGFGSPFFAPPPPVIVVPPPVVFAANVEPQELPPEPLAASRPPVSLPLAKPGDFVVFRPQKAAPPDEGVIVPKVDRVAPPPPAFRFDPLVKRDHVGKVERPDPDPATESARQMKLARAAFATEQYGKAVEHLDAATKARPDDALPHFLKAQVRFAAGQYPEAVAHVRDGMKLAPEWPGATFRAKEMYAGAEARFDRHLADLAKAADANPDEPGLTFLLGYQLWFGGDKPAAAKLFRAASKRVKDATLIDRFLLAAEKGAK